MATDQVIMTFVLMIPIVPLFIYKMAMFANARGTPLFFFENNWFEVLVFSLYFNKDCYLGQSIGKRLLRFRVLDIKTGRPANPLKCLVRNLTILIWPVEVIMAMIDVERRLGDFIAGTRLANYETLADEKPNWGLILLALVIGVGFTYVVFFSMEGLVRLVTRVPSAY
jgi:uncharacterized RDD family membrane protein YckC